MEMLVYVGMTVAFLVVEIGAFVALVLLSLDFIGENEDDERLPSDAYLQWHRQNVAALGGVLLVECIVFVSFACARASR